MKKPLFEYFVLTCFVLFLIGLKGGYVQGNAAVAEEESNVIWEDDFNTSSINRAKWDFEYGYVRNFELQEYGDSPQNAFIRDGTLVIRATRDDQGKWASACLMTNNKFEVGNARIEARIKIPKKNGAFPAFWMLGAGYEIDYKKQVELGDSWLAAREIDIMESFGKGMNVQGGVFFQETSEATALSHYFATSQEIDITQFHIYAIEKSDHKMDFYCDGNLYYSYEIKDKGLRDPFYLLLNLAVGSAGGTPDPKTTEMEMVVDYVRVTTLDGGPATELSSISLEKAAIYGRAGDIKKIGLKLSPLKAQNKTVVWKSSDSRVASVYGGFVHMKKAGTCTITATTYNGLSVTCRVVCRSNKE
ncbi:MAG TPA: family 16 glycosylhydrolase [Clostridiales bacterium]|nr:family 16 glycosylhydrolase [Clostridiales bacterium]